MHHFTPAETAAVYRAIAERRDTRHLLPDPVAPAVLARLLQAAHQAPSVGFMQPWRFLRITDAAVRATLHQLVEQERQRTAEALGERAQEFLKLKVEGLRGCGEVLVVALMDQREAHVFECQPARSPWPSCAWATWPSSTPAPCWKRRAGLAGLI